MPKTSLRYDDSNMWSEAVGKTGMPKSQWTAMLPTLRAAKRAVQKLARSGDQGFLDLPFDRTSHAACVSLARKLSSSFTDLVVLGIGGSDLGARALQQALAHQETKKQTMRVHFAGASTDPDELSRLIARLNLKKTCINVISKSGDTLETMSAFLILRDRLIKAVGAKRIPAHTIATTDAESGSLRMLAKKEGYHTLTVPGNVGGRFSTLSAVGLFPAHAMGIDTDALLSGARAFVEAFHECSPNECFVTRYAALHVSGFQKRGQNVHVTMPYSASLSEFGRWVRQIIAESLGKKITRTGKTVHTGPTPVFGTGPEDQHSQVQLYTEGPFDKLVTFIEVSTFHQDLTTPSGKGLGGSLERFGNRSLADLIHLERSATAESLRQNKRPNGTIIIERLDAKAMGELMLFFELSTALMGELLDVNAYNQPGVELSKTLVRNGLGTRD